jgi:predicted component of type VI protein secretion system
MVEDVQLVMIEGPRPGWTFSLDKQILILGRDPRNDIAIDHPQVSRRHARITLQEDVWVIEDLESMNGTFVNGRRLVERHTLAKGDAIGLSEAVTLVYRKQAAPAEDTVAARPAAGPPAPHPSPPRDRDRVQQGYSPRPAPPPTYRASSVSPGPQERPPQDRIWLWLGIGCAVLLLVVACTAVFVLDYFRLLPTFFYEPLRWLGLI